MDSNETYKAVLNPGIMLDDLGVTCEQLYTRFKLAGDYPSQEAMWNALQDFAVRVEKRDSMIPEGFGSES